MFKYSSILPFVFALLLWNQSNNNFSVNPSEVVATFTFEYTGPNFISVDDNCEAILDWGHPNSVTLDYDGPGVITFFDVVDISGGFQEFDPVPGGTTVTIEYLAEDDMGNDARFSFMIDFVDDTPPLIDPNSVPGNILINCITELPDTVQISAFDNCDPGGSNISYHVEDVISVDTCGEGQVSRRYFAVDSSGNSTARVQLIIVAPDTIAPVFSVLPDSDTAICPDIEMQYAAWLDSERHQIAATDQGCGNIDYSDDAPLPTEIADSCGEILVHFFATDYCGNATSTSASFLIQDNKAPQITSEAEDITIDCSQNNAMDQIHDWIDTHGGATATDNCSSNLSWTSDPANIAAEISCDQATMVTFIVQDLCGNTNSTSAMISLEDDTPPSLTNQPNDEVAPCAGIPYREELQNYIDQFGFANVFDRCTAEEDLRMEFILDGDTIDNQTLLDSLDLNAAMGCRDSIEVGGIIVNSVLAYLDFQFIYIDLCDNQRISDTVRWAVRDLSGPSLISPGKDTLVSCVNQSQLISSFDEWYQMAAFAEIDDDCGGLSVSTTPSYQEVLDSILYGNLACDGSEGIAVEFTVSDLCNNPLDSVFTATYSILDTLGPEIISASRDTSYQCDDSTQNLLNQYISSAGFAMALDACSDSPFVSFEWTDSDGNSGSGDAENGPYPQLDSAGCNYFIDFTWVFEDRCSNSAESSAHWVLIDTLPPDFSSFQDTLLVNCDSIPGQEGAEILYQCSSSLMIDYSDSVTRNGDSSDCSFYNYRIDRLYFIETACGVSDTLSQVLMVEDLSAPNFQLPPDITVDCNADTSSMSTGEPTDVIDGCDSQVGITYSDQIAEDSCGYIISREWHFEDVCGNDTTGLQVILVIDTMPPEFNFQFADTLVNCADSVGIIAAFEEYMNYLEFNLQPTDNCGLAYVFIAEHNSYEISDTSTYPENLPEWNQMSECGDSILSTAQYDLVAIDKCMSANIQTVSFSVIDTIAPRINCPDTIQIVIADSADCIGITTFENFTADENCELSDSLVWELIDQSDTLRTDLLDTVVRKLPIGLHDFTLRIEDCSKNISTCHFQVLVKDTIPPLLTCPPDTSIEIFEGSCEVSVPLPDYEEGGHCDTISGAWYFVTGSTVIDTTAYTYGDEVTLGSGEHEVFVIVEDASLNSSVCSFDVTVIDTVAPRVICTDTTLVLNTSGNHFVEIEEDMVVFDIIENCEIDTVIINASAIGCESIGDTIVVEVEAIDMFGNSHSCTANVYVQAEEWTPSYFVDFCNADTLFLFSNIPSDTMPNQYIYSWTGPNGYTSSERNPVLISPNTSHSGTYYLAIKGSTGCTMTDSVAIDITSFSRPPVSQDKMILCEGDSVTLSSFSYPGDVVYSWYEHNDTGDVLLAETDINSYTLSSDLGVHEYYLQVSNSNCSSEPSALIEVEFVSMPVLMVESDSIEICEGETLILELTQVDSSLEYSWTGPGNFMSSQPIVEITEIELFQSGTYSVQAHRGDCYSNILNIVVEVFPSPLAPSLELNAISCAWDSLRIYANSPIDYDLYVWEHESGLEIQTDTAFLDLLAYPDSLGGIWRVRSYAESCFSPYSNEIEVLINPLPDASITSNAPVCPDGMVHLEAVEQSGAEYVWHSPDGEEKQGRSVDFIADTSGYYTLKVRSQDFCFSEDSIKIEIVEAAVIEDVIIEAANCIDSSDIIVVFAMTNPTPDSHFVYHWIFNDSTISIEDTLQIEHLDSSKMGEYKLLIYRGSCPSDTTTFDLELPLSPASPRMREDTVFCAGQDFQLYLENDNAERYEWQTPHGNVETAEDSITIEGLEAGNYEIIVTAFNGNCASAESDSLSITVSAIPESLEILGQNSVCSGDSLYLSTQDIEGASYVWSDRDGVIDTTDSDFLIYPADTSATGHYSVKVLLGPCETDFSEEYYVAVNQNPEVPVIESVMDEICILPGAVLTVCISESSATPGATYQWFNADTGEELGDPTAALCTNISDLSSFNDGLNSIMVMTIVESCESQTSIPQTIQLHLPPDLEADAGADIPACEQNVEFLNAVPASDVSGEWVVLTAGAELEDLSNPHTQILELQPGENLFVWTLSNATCTHFSTDTVTVFFDVPPIAFDDEYQMPFGGTLELDIEANDDILGGFNFEILSGPQNGRIVEEFGILNYFPNNGYIGMDEFVYEICSSVCPEKCDSASVMITVGDESLCDIPNVFTPNNDGTNDFFTIQCLSSTQYPNNKLQVFNINGDEVYSASPYTNDWQGTYRDKDLPAGTYFYVLNFGDGRDVEKGFLIIER